MSTFADQGYCSRETYFVLFDKSRRPTLEQLGETLGKLDPKFHLANGTRGDAGEFETLTVFAPEDFAAVDISYVEDEDVTSETTRLVQELRSVLDRATLRRIADANARFDVMHFERTSGGEEDGDDVFDPSALLMVLSALAELTEGVGVDPQSGAVM